MIELREGDKIGGFVVKGRLGKGGMGEVYLVNDPRLAIDRALKVIALKRESGGRQLDTKETREFRARFLREARTLARLRHPHIIPVHAVDEHEGHPFLVMTHFPSKDARSWLSDDQPQLDEVKLVADQIAAALAFAHGHGVLHRDIKLSNLLVGTAEHAAEEIEQLAALQADQPDGGGGLDVERVFALADERARGPGRIEAMLIDFGLAKSVSDPELTHTNRKMGTYSYMAPEYLAASQRGERPKHTQLTDLWALGCLLYGLTCHRLPFEDTNDVELFRKIQEGEFPTAASLRCDASAEWTAVIDDLLEVEPGLRIQSARELVERLAAVSSAIDLSKAPFVPDFNVDAELDDQDIDPEGGVERVDDRNAPTTIFESGRDADPPAAGAATPKHAEMPPLDVVEGLTMGAGRPSGEKPILSNFVGKAVARRAATRPSAGRAPAPPAEAAGSHADEAASLSVSQPESSVAPRRGAQAPFRAAAAKAPSTQSLALRRLALPLVAALIVFLGGGAVVFLTGSARAGARDQPMTSFVDPDELARRGRSDHELAEIERAKDARALPIVIAPSPAPALPSPSLTAAEAPSAASRASNGRPRGTRAPTRAEPRVASAADPFTARYGSRVDFNQSSGPPVTATASESKAAGAVAGVKIPVRVLDAIVSSPTGPVIAIVTQPTKVGGQLLPSGTQIHGQTAGTSGSRVLVSFLFAIVDGRNVPLRGSALGLDGRAGVPGTKSFGGASDVAAGGAVGGAQGAVDALSSAVDSSIVGSAIRGAGNPGAQKLGRINNEEEVVATARGARLFVYVGD